MARFVCIGSEFINVDHVISVSKPYAADAPIWVEMDTGVQLEVNNRYLDSILGMEQKEEK